jgi:hypothetical protein
MMICLCSAERYKTYLAPIFATFDISEEDSVKNSSLKNKSEMTCPLCLSFVQSHLRNTLCLFFLAQIRLFYPLFSFKMYRHSQHVCSA